MIEWESPIRPSTKCSTQRRVIHTAISNVRYASLAHQCLCVFQTTNYDSVLQTAESIAKQAHDLAYDPNYMSPFAQFACDNGLNVRGEASGLFVRPGLTLLDLEADPSSGYPEAKCPQSLLRLVSSIT